MNKIFLFGDSTCQYNDESTFPQVGWGQFFSEYLKDQYQVINLAKNGRSTRTFKVERLYEPCQKEISKGDYLFIQFGHNDEKVNSERFTEPYKDYQENLLFYINIARNSGATPVLLSSIYRRRFKKFGHHYKLDPNCHGEYPRAMEELAKRENVIFLDLTKASKEYIENMGRIKSKSLFMISMKGKYDYPDKVFDNTHLVEKGARAVCELIKKECLKNDTLKVLFK